jgi:acyl-CoA synthetase (NDP forming)
MSSTRRSLHRLLRPASIAVIGGDDAAEVIRQCRRSGYDGTLWAVSATRDILAGLRCCPSVDALPAAPDAAFVAVPREQAVQVVAALSRRGAGGAVCYASGFAEVGDEGEPLQRSLLQAAGDMPLLGPNCYGLLNHLDGSALWPDRAGGRRVELGVAILTQSGNIGLNLSMQRHYLPVACMVSLGNMAQLGFHDLIDALLDDPRISAIGLHIEGLSDVAAFSAVALRALRQGVPIVALKTGTSALGAQLAGSHTRALSGPDRLVDALFDRVGIARVHDLPAFLEALKLLHVCGPLNGTAIGSLSCSGGEASLVADLGERAGLAFPPLPAPVQRELHEVLGPQVPLANPLDYHTYIWAQVPALTRCFAALRQAPIDASLLVLDFPNVAADGSDQSDALAPGWAESLDAYLAARAESTTSALVVSTLAELMPPTAAERALAAGVAPMQGLSDCLQALAAAAHIGRRRADAARRQPVAMPTVVVQGKLRDLDEAQAKTVLAAMGVPVPAHRVVLLPHQAPDAAQAVGYPVAVKTVAAGLLHKSEAGAVQLNLGDAEAVQRAVASMPGPWLIEAMASGGVAELLVGITHDPQFGHALTLGAGGVWVELFNDTCTLLLPARREEIETALRSLRCAPLLAGYRGKPAADMPALLDAVEAVLRYAAQHAGQLRELEINPLIALPRGALAVDAVVRLVDLSSTDASP